MKPDEIMKALKGVDSAYLESALEQPPQKATRVRIRPGMRLCLIAAILVLTGGTVFAAWKALNIESKMAPEGWYEIYFLENPAAPDAPDHLEEYYLPAVSQDLFIRESTVLSLGKAFTSESRVTWTYGDPWKELDEEINRWNRTWAYDENGQAKLLSEQELATLEKEHPLPSAKIEQIIFSQMPLSVLPDDNVLETFFTDAGPLVKGGVLIDGREYVTMGNVEETIYLWADEALHYVFYLRCTNGIPLSEQENIVCSVTKVDQETYMEQTGLSKAKSQKLWLPQTTPADYTQYSALLILPDRSDDLSVTLDWQDDKGHQITYAQGFTYTEEDLADSEHFRRTVDGNEIMILRRKNNVDGKVWIDESWYYTVPDDHTSVWLDFFSTDGTELNEAEKLSMYQSVQPIELSDLVR